ncbi:MAG: HprK-related kinase A [Rheinheimera sp.]|nr:MAG: HprK-related kinase A [Rheinheimera sp.]
MTFSQQFLSIPPFCFELSTDVPLVSKNIRNIYPQSVINSSDCPDYFFAVQYGNGLRRIIRPQARFFSDQHEPFKPISLDCSFALLEWGMNWCIATQEMRFVIVHAAVLEKDGKAILFPAPPGSGKSTLTAWLAFHGWRLLSDEMALLLPGSQTVVPFVRPICLKNNSITLAKSWFPDARFSTIARNTHKGDVVHLSPPAHSWENNRVPAQVVAIVFPKYQQEQPLTVTQLNQAQAFSALAENAFNFSLGGQAGFETIVKLVEKSQCYEACYNDVAELEEFLTQDVLPYANI